jgi:hypothetical protein
MKLPKILTLQILMLFVPLYITAQKYKLTNSEVSFFSEAPLENIEAHNKQTTSLFDVATGEIAFVVPIKGFQFKKSLMQEHFNENYMESDKYPNGTFKGKVSGYDPEKSGKQTAVAEGDLTIHGVTRKVRIEGTLQLQSGKATLNATFPVKLVDHDIEIPQVVFYNIAEVVEVTVQLEYASQES